MPPITTKESIGLGNVDNTSDLNKPISTATQTALNAKANTGSSNTFGARQIVSIADGTIDGALMVTHSDGFTQKWINSGAGGGYYNWAVTRNTYSSGGGRLLLLENAASTTSPAMTVFGGKFGFGVGNYTPTCVGDFLDNTGRLRNSRTPASATAAGNQGDHCWDANYFYNAPATNSWQRVIRNTVASPAQFTANQNNWAPTIAKTWRVSTDAARDITGINIGQWGGDEHYLVNVGSNNVVLKHQDTNSTAAYRFISVTGADITLAAGEMAFLWYDSTSLRWRIAKV